MRNILLTAFVRLTRFLDNLFSTHPVSKKGTKQSVYSRYTIKKGNHYCKESRPVGVEGNEMKFIVKFNNSAVYTSQENVNQFDINKLWGFKEGFTEDNSARIGWNFMNGSVNLYPYVHYNGNNMGDEDPKSVPVEIGKAIPCSIKVEPNKYVITINGQVTDYPRFSQSTTFEGFQLFPYFGGDEKAPHTITVLIK